MFDPDAFLSEDETTTTTNTFNPDAFLGGAEPEEKTGRLESFGRGLAQGASFGFSDEMSAWLESFFKGTEYQDELDKNRSEDTRAREDNPLTFGGGDLAGSLATMAVPGGGAGLALRGAKAAKSVGDAAKAARMLKAAKAMRGVKNLGPVKGAALGGAVYGAGTAEGDLMDRAGEAIEGGIIGGGLGYGMDRLGAGLSKLGIVDKLKGGAKNVLGAVTDVKRESIDRALERGTGKIREAMEPGTMKQIGRQLNVSRDKLQKAASQQSKKAFDILEKSGAKIKKERILDIIDDSVAEAKKYGDYQPGGTGFKKIEKFREMVQKDPDLIPAQNVKRIVQTLDDMTRDEVFGAQAAPFQAVSNMRSGIDKIIKTSGEYRKQMEKVRDMTRLNKLLRKNFTGGSRDRILGSLKKAVRNKDDSLTYEALEEADKFMGTGFADRTSDVLTAADFTADKTRGSKGVLAGGGIGYAASQALGIPYPAAIIAGGLGGMMRDKYGGRAALSALGGYEKAKALSTTLGNKLGSKSMKPYRDILVEAAEKSPIQLAATHYIMQKTDEKYRKKAKE